MNFEESSYFSNMRKNDQNKFDIFGKDFSVKKSEKKIKKKSFLFFLNLFFFTGERQIGFKTGQNYNPYG